MIFYVQQKNQVKIYLSKINASSQQKQLLSLLDSVPDKVLICSKKLENKDLSVVYSN